MIIVNILLCFFLVIGLEGCQSEQEDTPKVAAPKAKESVNTVSTPAEEVQQQTVSLLQEPIVPVLVENPAQALAYWQQHKASRPTLILLSNDPFLQPLPTQTAKQVLSELASASRQEIVSRSTARIANPLLMPAMATSAALRGQLFSSIIWEVPTDTSRDKLSAQAFRTQLLDLGVISDEEASSIEYDDGVFSGRVRNVPFQARHPQAMTPVTGPVIVHIDVGYFSPLYEGEIKTKLYPLIYKTLDKLRQQAVHVLAVTISYSNQSGNLPLNTRFIGPDLATIFQQPTLLDKELPRLWKQRSKVLFLPNFFQVKEINQLLLDMDISDPGQASIKYALYQAQITRKQGDVALGYLAQAVALDSGYGLEYLALSSLARDNNLPDKSLEMLQLAAKTFPDDPFIKIQIISHLQKRSQIDPAHKILEQLQGLDWSETFYPNWPAKLEELKNRLAEQR
jgi:hypothetical protein